MRLFQIKRLHHMLCLQGLALKHLQSDSQSEVQESYIFKILVVWLSSAAAVQTSSTSHFIFVILKFVWHHGSCSCGSWFKSSLNAKGRIYSNLFNFADFGLDLYGIMACNTNNNWLNLSRPITDPSCADCNGDCIWDSTWLSGYVGFAKNIHVKTEKLCEGCIWRPLTPRLKLWRLDQHITKP